jgi:formylglycine-generating enzyme
MDTLRYENEEKEAQASGTPCARKCGCSAQKAAAGVESAQPDKAMKDMVWIGGGSFLMGSEKFYREERPVRRVLVEGFWIDPHPVTNAQFKEFIDATSYLTVAERSPDPTLYPDADPSLLVAGSLVFTKPDGPVSNRDYRQWWAYVPGASWRHPKGPESSLDGLDSHPVVQVAYEDACAYAAWAGKTLPTEEEWEFAALGGLKEATYAWGEEFMPGGWHMANTWQGRFPYENLSEDGFDGTSPVGAFPANGYGLVDMIGNVWEWTTSPYEVSPVTGEKKSCCVPGGGNEAEARIVVKGGSHLCAPNYCLRYRPSARQGQTLDTSTTHIGFRCIVRQPHSGKK